MTLRSGGVAGVFTTDDGVPGMVVLSVNHKWPVSWLSPTDSSRYSMLLTSQWQDLEYQSESFFSQYWLWSDIYWLIVSNSFRRDTSCRSAMEYLVLQLYTWKLLRVAIIPSMWMRISRSIFGGTFVFADEAALANFPNHNLGHVIHKVAGHGLQAAELLHDTVRQHGVHGIVQTPTCLLGLISSELWSIQPPCFQQFCCPPPQIPSHLIGRDHHHRNGCWST